MFDANNNPGVRVPRNAIRIWQSDKTVATLPGWQLTKSLRDCTPLSPSLVHPVDWPSRCGFEALRETAYDLSRHC